MDREAPFVRTWWTRDRIIVAVIIALMPSAAAGTYYFGISAFLVLLCAVSAALATDFLCQALAKRYGQGHIFRKINWSSFLTGLLLGLVLPPKTPLAIVGLGSVVAVAIGKYAFGEGNNIFNPALMARVFLALSFPVLMAGWVYVDGISSATPLAAAKEGGYGAVVSAYGGVQELRSSLFFGSVGGSIGETSALALLAGGLALIILRIIDWRVPAGYLGTVALFSSLLSRDILFDLLAGGLMLGAFFMATDYVTSPLTRKGRWVFAAGCAVLTMVFRVYSGHPEGVAFSILLMNSAVPLIDRHIRPVPFSKGGGRK